MGSIRTRNVIVISTINAWRRTRCARPSVRAIRSSAATRANAVQRPARRCRAERTSWEVPAQRVCSSLLRSSDANLVALISSRPSQLGISSLVRLLDDGFSCLNVPSVTLSFRTVSCLIHLSLSFHYSHFMCLSSL